VSIVYRRAPYDPLQDWMAFGARVWLLAWEKGGELVAGAGRLPHAKVAVWGALVIVALVTTLHATTRAVAPLKTPPQPLAQRLDDALTDAKAAEPKKADMLVRKIDMSKQSEVESRMVKTERITAPPAPIFAAPPPVAVPPQPVAQVQEEEPPPVATRRRMVTRVARGGDICTRHGMRKEITRGGKSWRCRR